MALFWVQYNVMQTRLTIPQRHVLDTNWNKFHRITKEANPIWAHNWRYLLKKIVKWIYSEF